jgi:transcription antitermination factor NusG
MIVLRRFLAFVALALCATAVSCSSQPDPASAATAFLEMVGNGKASEAYDTAAFGFQAQQTKRAFEQTARQTGISDYASVVWEPAEGDEKVTKLKGEITTKSGAKIPMLVTMNRESGQWRVFSLRSPRGASGQLGATFTLVGKPATFSDRTNEPIPNEQALRELTRKTLLMFNESVQSGSFDDFYTKVSTTWQKQLTENMLKRAFQPFIDQKVDISGVKDLKATFDPPPYVSTDGLLIVPGRYPTTPYATSFLLKFIYELPNWKLFGIDVRLEKPKEEAEAAKAKP